MVLASEVVVFAVELLALTLMGIIVNAGSLLRYLSLLILLALYAFNSFSQVSKTYSKTLKHLFHQLKQRCNGIDDVTSLPAHLQQNVAFKSQELSEQADYEHPDDFVLNDHERSWRVNDLVLFIDTQDTPRLPRRLFEEVCKIRTVGSPGPVYSNVLRAVQSFLKIAIFVAFVFVVVGVFGSIYNVSSTNQMMATLAGGSLPLIARKFFAPSKSDTEFDTVSFQSKLDEIIKSFDQTWPMFDLHFELWTTEDRNRLTSLGLADRPYYRRLSLSPTSTCASELSPMQHPLSFELSKLEQEATDTSTNTNIKSSKQRVDLLIVRDD